MKILIAYYSYSQNTKKLANLINKAIEEDFNNIQIDIFNIEPDKPYSSNYNVVVEDAKKEISKNYKPKLKSNISSIDNYDIIFIGSPNWWNTFAPPVNTFITSFDFSKKIIMPFCTHGGGGFGNIQRDIEKTTKSSNVSKIFSVYGSDNSILNSSSSIKKWIAIIKNIKTN